MWLASCSERGSGQLAEGVNTIKAGQVSTAKFVILMNLQVIYRIRQLRGTFETPVGLVVSGFWLGLISYF